MRGIDRFVVFVAKAGIDKSGGAYGVLTIAAMDVTKDMISRRLLHCVELLA